MVIVSKVRFGFQGCGSSNHTTGDPTPNAMYIVCPSQVCDVDTGWIGGGVSASTRSGGEYLDFPIEGNSIKYDGLNRLITVVTALTYPYKTKSPLFHRCYSEGDAAARTRCVVGVTKRLALQTTRYDRNAQLRSVPGVWWGRVEGVRQHQPFQNSIASQPLIIYFNYPISDCSTLLIMQFVIVLH